MARVKRGEAERRLLDAWTPPDGAGEAIGCVATTFTFDPVFFEEHCISRFLRLETDPREDGAAYLIEREEKLAATVVSVLVDRSQAEGSASPRWDVLPVTVRGGVCHAKMSLLVWHGWIRLLVASANLTEKGYRQNQEVFGSLDFRDGGEAPPESLEEVLGFLRGLTDLAPGSLTEQGPKMRLIALLDQARMMSRRWSTTASRRNWPQVKPILLAPMETFATAVPARLGQLMRDRGGPAHSALVLSPFFDRADGEGTYPGTQALVAVLTERGERCMDFMVPGEKLPDGRLRLRAPRSLVRSDRRATELMIYPVDEVVDQDVRPLHAKSIWLWNERWHVYMVGSSNFTVAGQGLHANHKNIEANLAYVFPVEGGIHRLMAETLPSRGEAIENLDAVLWEPIEEVEGEDPTATAPLPTGFEEALFVLAESSHQLVLRFDRGLPGRWLVREPKTKAELYGSDQWAAEGTPATKEIVWAFPAPPSAVDVEWSDRHGVVHSAVWPVNVSDPSRLPPPDDLRNLSLETLVEILGARLPLHEAVRRARERAAHRGVEGNEAVPADIDPLRRVRTETFLLQRTRRVAKALENMVESIGRPVAHRDALLWRLRGPVGPLALARALAGAARSPGEACFLLAEVVLALRRVDVRTVAVGLATKEVRAELDALKAEIDGLARPYLRDSGTPEPMVAYVSRALEEARR